MFDSSQCLSDGQSFLDVSASENLICYTCWENSGVKLNGGVSLCECAKASWTKEEEAKNFCEKIKFAQIPFIYLGGQKNLFLPDVSGFIYIHGKSRVGKTTAACAVLLESLKKDDGLYISTADLLQLKNTPETLPFGKDHDDARQILNNHVKFIKKQCKLLVLDQFCQEKLSQKDEKFLFELLDRRYGGKMATILISNNEPRADYIGDRLFSRIKNSKIIHMCGDQNNTATPVEPEIVIEVPSTVSKEEAENFSFADASPKLMTLDDNTNHIMNWLARNPAFETVSTQKRHDLTEIVNGKERDRNRDIPSVHENVWINGDYLIVDGPLCDHEDKKLYAFLVNELVQNHRAGFRGLEIELSFSYILRGLGIKKCGSSVDHLKMQLERLNRMHLDFNRAKKKIWAGPLLTTISEKGESSDQRIKIEFNRYMIYFYRLHEYTTFNRIKSKKLKNDSSAFYFFYSSHTRSEMIVPVEKCKKLLGIPESFDKKDALRRVRKAVQNLIDADVMDQEKTFVKNGKVHTSLLLEN